MNTYTIAYHSLTNINDNGAVKVNALSEKDAEIKAIELIGIGFQIHTTIRH
jgi:hypothetical protein